MDHAALLTQIDDAFAESLGAGSRAPVAITCQVEGVLLPEDIRCYLDEHGQLTTTLKADEKDIRQLRERHHSVARLLSEGLPQGLVATMTGYTEQYISVLKASPAMMELIEHYRAPGGLAVRHVGENLRRVAGMALEQLEGKIEQDQLTASELTAAAKLGYDRSGHGPQSSLHSITEHHIIDHSEIAARHLEAKRRDAEMIVHPEEVRRALPKPSSSEPGAQPNSQPD